MFQITRLAANMTKVARSTVKNVAKNKINLENASDSIKLLHSAEQKAAPYSKNIFKRAYIWTKQFVQSFVTIKNGLKQVNKHYKEVFNNKLDKKLMKDIKSIYFGELNTKVESVRQELGSLLKKTKVEK